MSATPAPRWGSPQAGIIGRRASASKSACSAALFSSTPPLALSGLPFPTDLTPRGGPRASGSSESAPPLRAPCTSCTPSFAPDSATHERALRAEAHSWTRLPCPRARRPLLGLGAGTWPETLPDEALDKGCKRGRLGSCPPPLDHPAPSGFEGRPVDLTPHMRERTERSELTTYTPTAPALPLGRSTCGRPVLHDNKCRHCAHHE